VTWVLTGQLAISPFLTVPDSGASGFRGWLAGLTVPGRLGEKSHRAWVALTACLGRAVSLKYGAQGWRTGSAGYGCGWEYRCIFGAPSATVCSANTVTFIQELNHKGMICK